MHDSKRLFFEISPIDPDDKFGKTFARASAYPEKDDIRRHIHPQTWDFL